MLAIASRPYFLSGAPGADLWLHPPDLIALTADWIFHPFGLKMTCNQ
ncbi:MAG: hypothetical protein ACI9ZF_002468, partial [Bradyrhizobium sp.]